MSGTLAVLCMSIIGLLACLAAAISMARRGWGAGAFFLAAYAALYFLAPAYLAYRALGGRPFVLDFVAAPGLQETSDLLPVALEVLFALVFVVVYGVGRKRGCTPDLIVPRVVPLGGRPVHVSWLMTVAVGLVGYWGLVYYANQYGGFVEAAAVATYVRAGAGRDFQIGDSVFSYRLADIGFIAFAAMPHSTTRRKVLAFLMGLPFLLYIAIFAKGKANFLALAIVPFIYYSLVRKKNPVGLALALGAAAMLLVPTLQDLLFSDGESGAEAAESWVEGAVRFVAHPHLSTIAALEHDGPRLYLNDFVAGLGGQIVPTSWMAGVAPFSSIEVNSEAITHVFERNIPPGPVAFGYYSFGLPGVVAWAVVLALVCAYVDRLVIAARKSAAATFVLACLIFTLSNGVYHGVPEYVFYWHRVVICALFITIGFRSAKPSTVTGLQARPDGDTGARQAEATATC